MSTRNEIRRKVLHIMQRDNMRRIAYMHGYVFSRCMHELSSARFQSASRVKMRDGVSFRERGKFHDVVRTFQKRRKKLHETGSNRFEPVHRSLPKPLSDNRITQESASW